MTSRDLVISALNHEPVERVPRDLWAAPAVRLFRADELDEVSLRFPSDIVRADFEYPPGKAAKGKPLRPGKYTDAWGCTWQVSEEGAKGETLEPPLADPAGIAQWRPPMEVLNGARLGRVARQCASTSRFVLARTQTRPFDRLRWLRGAAAVKDLARGARRIHTLLERLHEFSCREMELWANSDVDGVAFGDDWHSPGGLPISRQTWREVFRPLYTEYCSILHAKDKFAFFRSEGDITDIFGDLVKTGVDAIHARLFAMNIERLAKRYRGKVTFWGDIDRSEILSSTNLDDIVEAVRRVRRALDFGAGGMIAQCQWDPDVPRKNIVTVFEQWMLPMPMHV